MAELTASALRPAGTAGSASPSGTPSASPSGAPSASPSGAPSGSPSGAPPAVAPRLRLHASTVPASALTRGTTLIGRTMRLSRRNVETLMMSLMLPVMLMLMFVYLFGGAIHTGTRYVTYVVPGVIMLCASFGSSMTAVSVCQDMTGGIIDRFRSMNVGGVAIVTGHVVASVARNMFSTAVVFGVAFAIGFRPKADLVQWLGTAAVLALVIATISWFSATIGLLAKSPDAASGFTFLVTFFPYASSAFVPIGTMPSWLHGFARNQPTTPIIETMRGLLLDQPIGLAAWHAVLWCLGILIGSVILSVLFFRRRTG